MEIKLIGADSKNGMRLLKNIEKMEREMKCKLNILKIASKNRDKYGIREIPALMIENELVSKGCVLTERKIKNIIKKKLELCNN